ncbi:gamma-butyrobetaine hydroxylase-like domain-containing protein [Oligoflexia bacterium]|nr:gamma-butyrobetaine hydroxylase-like domain-containing protein [Oligoflexia bacterium]
MSIQKPNTIVFASLNSGKVLEVTATAEQHGVAIIAPQVLIGSESKGFGFDCPLTDPPRVVEDADTYLGNAQLKAQGFWSWCKLPCLADDTGLEVDALKGAPGLYSARFAGEDGNAQNNRAKLLTELEGVQDRKARFRCVLYFMQSKDSVLTVDAVLEGAIALNEKGGGGFGYDSLFVVDGYGETLAALKEQNIPVKTHRVLALEKFFRELGVVSHPKPTEIKRLEDAGLRIKWSDGSEHELGSRKLRLACPCAGCQGESARPLTEAAPAPAKSLLNIIDSTVEEQTKLLEIQPVGNYAIRLKWGDGHNTGFYRYSLLWDLANS